MRWIIAVLKSNQEGKLQPHTIENGTARWCGKVNEDGRGRATKRRQGQGRGNVLIGEGGQGQSGLRCTNPSINLPLGNLSTRPSIFPTTHQSIHPNKERTDSGTQHAPPPPPPPRAPTNMNHKHSIPVVHHNPPFATAVSGSGHTGKLIN